MELDHGSWDDISEDVQDNRNRFLNLISAEDLWVANISLDKARSKFVIHRHAGLHTDLQEVHSGNTDQLDY